VNVIAGTSGHTICYRDDLINILHEIAPHGLPPLANILICISACQGTIYQHKIEKSLDDLDQLFKMTKSAEQARLDEYRRQAKALMTIIGALPADLRTGTRRIHLIIELFKDSHDKISPEDAQELIDDFSSGKSDAYIAEVYDTWDAIPKTWVTDIDIADLQDVVKSYHDTEQLALRLRTGVIAVPEKLEVQIPETKSEPARELIDELLEDERTVNLALLTQRLIAALNIPMHAANASDHSYGGISDISNRGNFDRLLLSELANDDMSLMARLVNNEALYLRREAPPVNFDRCRNILIDTTIRMWGVPRFFSISAALACAQNHYHTSSVDAFALGRDSYEKIDLNSKEGVINTLERLDAGLDSWPSLISFFDEQDYQSNTENILIVGDDFFQAPSYLTHHDEIQKKLHYLIMVSRSGDLQFYEFINGRRKLMSTSKFDLDEIFTQKVKPRKRVESNGKIPAFYEVYPCPLYYPTMNMKAGSKNMFKAIEGLVGVNEHQRLLYWRNSLKGARELYPNVERGTYCFGARDKQRAYLVVYTPHQDIFKLYNLDLLNESAVPIDIDFNLGIVREVIYHDGTFYIKAFDGSIICLDAESGLRSFRQVTESDFGLYKANYNVKYPKPTGAKKFVNPGYGVFQRLSHVGINGNDKLVVSGYSLLINRERRLELKAENKYMKAVTGATDTFYDPSLPHVRFFVCKWSDGSEVMIDSHGLIHLRSSDKTMAEITFASILDKPNVCWASDYTVSGSTYFYDSDDVMSSGRYMDTEIFYEKYIQRFIDHIISTCS
jgi:hypothetical protein